jgi:hypothetical protein
VVQFSGGIAGFVINGVSYADDPPETSLASVRLMRAEPASTAFDNSRSDPPTGSALRRKINARATFKGHIAVTLSKSEAKLSRIFDLRYPASP